MAHRRGGAPVERLRRAVPLRSADRRWLALALLPGFVAVAVYLATNPYPAYSGGLFSKIAMEIAANGYVPPARIPGYTADGVPYAYPPLQFYVLAALFDLGADPVGVARFLPSVGFLAALLPLYLLARDVTGSRPAGTAAAALVAVNPQVIEWHLSAGGVVRAFAYLYALTAIYAAYHVFTTGDRRAVALGVGAFGLALLTHPTYALFVVASYLLFWAVLDRSAAGLVRGAVVGVGGALLASPWLAWVATTHGLGILTAAAGTHGGVGGGLDALAGEVSPFLLVPLVAGGYLLVRREPLLPAWLVAVELLFQQPRFAYTAAAVLVPAVGVALVRDAVLRDRVRTPTAEERALGAALLVVVATLGGGAYLTYEMTLVSDPSTPEYLDDDSMAAFEWVRTETDEDATFVVVGDVAEWLPALTDRTILVGPWGVEWEGPEEFNRQLAAHKLVASCRSSVCVEAVADAIGQRPDYVYVPKGDYTVWGDHTVRDGWLQDSFEQSPDWERAYENDGVVVYRSVAP